MRPLPIVMAFLVGGLVALVILDAFTFAAGAIDTISKGGVPTGRPFILDTLAWIEDRIPNIDWRP